MENNVEKCYEILEKKEFYNDDIFERVFRYSFLYFDKFSEIAKKSPGLFPVDDKLLDKITPKNIFHYIKKIFCYDGTIFEKKTGEFPDDESWWFVCELKYDTCNLYAYYDANCSYTGFSACGEHSFYVSSDLKNLITYALTDYRRSEIISQKKKFNHVTAI